MKTIDNISKSIISLLAQEGEMTISTIAQCLDYTSPTITKYINGLISSGTIEKCGKVSSTHGRKADMYRINKDAAYFIGVIPKQREISIALMDFSGQIIKEESSPNILVNTIECLEKICNTVEAFIDNNGIPRNKIKKACFGISGRVNKETGESYSLFNVENNDEPLAEWFSNRLGIKSIIDNDTRTMAFGELYYSVKDRFRDVLFINAGWGIGLGIIIDGKVFYGMNGYSGEIGHINVYDNDIICHCGKKGCLETVASGKAICNQFIERVLQGQSSILSPKVLANESITEKDIISAAQNDDQLSIELIEKAGAEIGRQIANLINVFNPQAVIIGGTLSSAGDFFVQSAKMAARRHCLRLLFQDVEFAVSTLADKAGIIGCCLEAREDFEFSI